MVRQAIQFEVDGQAVGTRIRGRRSVFLGTNAWIHLGDGVDETARRVRNKLAEAVTSGQMFCPASWGTLEELFLQAGDSLPRTAAFMEQLSLNAWFVLRTELYRWELARSLGRCQGAPANDSRSGLFTVPAAFVGSRPCVTLNLPGDHALGTDAVAHAQAFFQRGMSAIGIAELARRMTGRPRPTRSSPAYSEAAMNAEELFKGNRNKLFVVEAESCIILYIRPLLGPPISPETTDIIPFPAAQKWLAQFADPDGLLGWYRRCLAELPALYNFVDLMVDADMQPDRKDSSNHFMDYEIMAGPLAYADVFVSTDKGIRNVLRNTNRKILARTKCRYGDSLGELETWLVENAA